MRPVPVFLIVALAAQLLIEVGGANLTYCVEHHKSDKLDQFNKLEDCKDFCKKQPQDCQTYCAQHAHDNEWPCKSETSSKENATSKPNNATQGTPQNGVNPGQTTTPSANNLSLPLTSQSAPPYSDTIPQPGYRGSGIAPQYIDSSLANQYHDGGNPSRLVSGSVPSPGRNKKDPPDHILGNDGDSRNLVANILPGVVAGNLVGNIVTGTTGLLNNIGNILEGINIGR